MITKHTNASDFCRWEERARAMELSALAWSARDAREAASALDSHDPTGANRYRDEAMTYEREIERRKRS